MLVLVVTQSRNVRTGLVKGFSLAALALAGLSAAISGWSVFLIYPKFLLHLKAQPFAGIVPQAMANFRGLIYLFFHSDQSSGAVISLSILCAAALIATLWGWKKIAPNKKDDFDLAFANTVIVCIAGQLSPQPARPQPSAVADCPALPQCIQANAGCTEPCELDNLRLARNLVSASTSSLDAQRGRVCAHESSPAGLVLERGVSTAARRS